LLLTDEAWAELAPILATLKSRAGSPPALSDESREMLGIMDTLR